ncbi:MAG: histidine-type phosphatase [Alphaproteobacteria bacterium]|nr:histidine-type phosphatase [Alphaproteobacteria bacterium]
MSIRVVALGLLAVLLGEPAAAQILPIPPGWQLDRAVLLSRHGVRAPVRAADDRDRQVATPWPTWPVPAGELTPRGEQLLRLMGRYYRVLNGGRGLVQADDCPPRNTVVAWADTGQRTQSSGAALLAGMYPDCATPLLRSQTDTTAPDPLFDPPPSPSCPMDGAANRLAALARIGGDFSSVLREYAPQLASMQAVLCPPGVTPPGGACGLRSQPPAIVAGERGRIALTGPIAIGSSAGDTFLMQAAEGMPADQVAWGRFASDAELQDLLKIHRLDVDLAHKTLPIARQRGSNLLAQITATLQDGHKFPGLQSLAEPLRFGLLIGHEGNVANIARLLNVGWQIPGFQPNEITPGGALAFELLREVRTGRRYVRLAYYAQTLQQMRQTTVLELGRPPGMVTVDLPGCARDLHMNACPLERFVEIANQAIDPGCVTIKP